MSREILFFTLLLAFSGVAGAWQTESYEEAARRLCSEFNCLCEDALVEGSTLPPRKFNDAVEHHCYKPGLDYSMHEPWAWSEPSINDCPALDKVIAWLDEAGKKQGCARWHDIGTALNYFLDSKEFWNNVVEVNRSCVEEHESLVNDYLLFGDEWNACECGVCVSSEDFTSWMAEFGERVKPLVDARHNTNATVVMVSNSLDRAAALESASYLRNNSVDVVHATPESLKKLKRMEFIVVLGGQNAPEGTGEIVEGVLTEEDKALIMKAVLTGEAFEKRNVWANGQTVYFIAGHGTEETERALQSSRKKIAAKAVEYADMVEDAPECVKNDDCGTPYHGSWICRDRFTSMRSLYSPICRKGVCMVKSEKSSTRNCERDERCVPYVGCVHNKTALAYNDMVAHLPNMTSWISKERDTIIKGHATKLVLYFKNNNNRTNMKCEYYDSSEWTSTGTVTANGTVEERLNVTSNSTGKRVYSFRVRCGNVSASGESLVEYTATHNFTLNVIPPPLAFTFSLTPGNVSLDDCFDRENVTLRIENLCSHNITCNYTVFNVLYQVDVRPVGETYNVSNKGWQWIVKNDTHTYMTYYTGADFSNSSYCKKDANGTTICYNYSGIRESYTHDVNVTYYNLTVYKNTTSTYSWDHPHWTENIITVDSAECYIRWIPVTVTCTDEYGQVTTLEKRIWLEYTYD
ncbi:MAG: hypothetical protein GF416_00170 [Candidatus Altiarchaeales archaeon]|nr:hypothetical protein [Candidatus Altiarchaeales archaeon]MBD3415536.1 hypothetical protein [Candidatus Altiarchaeales archaeon]